MQIINKFISVCEGFKTSHQKKVKANFGKKAFKVRRFYIRQWSSNLGEKMSAIFFYKPQIILLNYEENLFQPTLDQV